MGIKSNQEILKNYLENKNNAEKLINVLYSMCDILKNIQKTNENILNKLDNIEVKNMGQQKTTEEQITNNDYKYNSSPFIPTIEGKGKYKGDITTTKKKKKNISKKVEGLKNIEDFGE